MKIEESIEIAVPAAEAWRVAGDIGSIGRWSPALESSTVDGDVRTAVFAGGNGTARERILKRDEEGRWYEYEYLDGPLALDKYVSRLSVEDRAGGSVVTWWAEFTAASPEVEEQLAGAVAGMYRQGLEGLHDLLLDRK
jgi:hypothetical protein